MLFEVLIPGKYMCDYCHALFKKLALHISCIAAVPASARMLAICNIFSSPFFPSCKMYKGNYQIV